MHEELRFEPNAPEAFIAESMYFDATESPKELISLTPFARDIAAGLTTSPKKISSKYLYDAVGSALFEAICSLEEYKCSRGEKRILHRHSHAIASALPPDVVVAELGGGSGEKAAIVLEALSRQARRVDFHNIDISKAALELSKANLAATKNVVFHGHATDFETGLSHVEQSRSDEDTMLLLFLGSSIGNFDLPAAQGLLRRIRSHMRPGDLFLLGTDLVKPLERLISAYDDPQGVTAAFNKNLLSRINRELGANFSIERFKHKATWNSEHNRIEMHLVSTTEQSVNIRKCGLTITFTRGESIHTENSHKYQTAEIADWVAPLNLHVVSQWVDKESLFATTLLRAK